MEQNNQNNKLNPKYYLENIFSFVDSREFKISEYTLKVIIQI